MTDIIFSNNKSEIKLSVDFEGQTVWATQRQIAELFDVNIGEVVRCISHIFIDGELEKDAVMEKRALTGSDGESEVFNLDMIISVGYRINSTKATEFRRWATRQLTELLTEGFVIDENRFAKGQLAAFQKLVDRVRAIRTSERNFYQKITDIFSTSSDYDKNSKSAKIFFAAIQNKFHHATHGHTAAELIKDRIDSNKINMGLTSLKGSEVTRAEAQVAKNYLSELEIKRLELLSEQFLSFAELRYYDKKEMMMIDWEKKLDEFLLFNEKEILRGKGKVSKEDMLKVLNEELSKYRAKKSHEFVDEYFLNP
jgi:hypothetical protein